MNELESRFPALAELGPITLGEMDSIKLMNRIDSKYVTTEAMLAKILERAAAVGYRVLVAEGERMNPYNTLYYDTPELAMYIAHQNGVLFRKKVRTRTYVNSSDSFLEIKRKNNHGRTKKKRMSIPLDVFENFGTMPEAAEFVEKISGYAAGQLEPRLFTRFTRITLVNAGMTERLTIDTHLTFHNVKYGTEATLNDGVIIELKQDGRCPSPMRGILLDLRVKPLRVSKYCIGTALTDPDVKNSRFRLKIRKIEKLTNKKLLR